MLGAIQPLKGARLFMTYILLHNPGCSTSRNGLALLQDKGVTLDVRAYMSTAQRLSVAELKEIAAKLGAASPREFARANTLKQEGISSDMSDADLYEAMAENPKLIQRPIGIKGDKAVLGRPFEKLLDLL